MSVTAQFVGNLTFTAENTPVSGPVLRVEGQPTHLYM